MAIPVALQSFKASGVYRIIYDKSTVLNEDTNILRLVVGYSEKGPFNTPVYVRSVSEFTSLFGNGSKKLEKRGIYFHRIAKQCLQQYPILVLNLKKFANEYVSGVSVNTNVQSGNTLKGDQIGNTKFFVTDIYDTTRFWTLDANKLHESDTTDNGKTYNKAGSNKSAYINISAVGAVKDSNTIFIRKASGSKVSSYNVTVSDWYSDGTEEIPEYLQDKLDSEISDYFAEIYVFKGQFTKKQIIASETLQSYFDIITEDGKDKIKLKPYILNAYGEKIDTLDALYADSASGAINHYVGSLIPYLKNKIGAYVDLSVLFNQDVDTHNMMMSFNTDLLEETDGTEPVNIDLSCSNNAVEAFNAYDKGHTSVLGNIASPVNIVTYEVGTNARTGEPAIVTTDSYSDDVYGASFSNIPTESDIKECKAEKYKGYKAIVVDKTIGGAIISGDRFLPDGCDGADEKTSAKLSFPSVQAIVDMKTAQDEYEVNIDEFKIGLVDRTSKWSLTQDDTYKYGAKIAKLKPIDVSKTNVYVSKTHALEYQTSTAAPANTDEYVWLETEHWGNSDYPNVDFTNTDNATKGFEVCTSDTENAVLINHNGIKFYVKYNVQDTDENNLKKADKSHTIWNFADGGVPNVGTLVQLAKGEIHTGGDVYGKYALNVLKSDSNITISEKEITDNQDLIKYTDTKPNIYDVASLDDIYDVTIDGNSMTGAQKEKYESVDAYFTDLITDTNSVVLIFDGAPYLNGKYIVRMEHSCNQEIGDLEPHYLEGYTYENDKPAGTSMTAKLNWQNYQLSALTEYKGVRTALLNKSEIDYRYIVDTFETFIDSEIKSVLSYLAKEKDSALFIGNLPSVKTFLKCPFNSYTDANGNFNVQYIVDGYNKKKSHTVKFSLPSEPNGASYAAFYTPLKFSDGYIDDIVPSAGLVSNLFVQKYYTRHPYDIIAGPNYGSIVMSGLTGPDYNYSKDELNIIEPYGFNCMVYRPNFGTFINANQTAKQTPKSALSSINVRELCIYIQDEIEKLLQSYQWEFNNAVIRQKIKDKADSICQNVMNNGGIQDYLNVMDESNNTPEIIDNEMSVLSTHIEPGRGMGKMVQELTLYRTGQMRATISES